MEHVSISSISSHDPSKYSRSSCNKKRPSKNNRASLSSSSVQEGKTRHGQYHIHWDLERQGGIVKRVLRPALDFLEKCAEGESRQLRDRQFSSENQWCVCMPESAPAFLQLRGGQHCHGCYAGDGDGEAGESSDVAVSYTISHWVCGIELVMVSHTLLSRGLDMSSLRRLSRLYGMLLRRCIW